MRKGRLVGIAALAIVISLCMGAARAQALEVISLSPGESTIREFGLHTVFDIRKLQPAELFVVLSSGDNETGLAGDLTVAVKPLAVKTFGSVVEFSIMGFSYAVGGKFAMVSQASAAPLELKRVIKMNTTFGLVLLGVYITDISGTVARPVPFSITFSQAVGK